MSLYEVIHLFSFFALFFVRHLHNNKIKTIGKHCFDGLDNLETL